MKMTDAQYKDLKDSIDVIAKHCKLLRRPDTSLTVLWSLLHEVNAQKSYANDHPRWQTTPRLLHVSHVHTASSYINELYKSGLNDSHIETALKQIAKDWGTEIQAHAA